MEKTFNESLEEFIEFCKEVCRFTSSGGIVASGSTNVLLSTVNKFSTIYKRTKDLPAHLDNCKEVYAKCRSSILNKEHLVDFMEWLMKQDSLCIKVTKDSKIKLNVSIIYKRCCEIADSLNQSGSSDSSQALVYDDICTLMLLRIFYHCATTDKERNKITSFITEIENDLEVDTGAVPDYKDAFAEITDFVSELTSEFGIPKSQLNKLKSGDIRKQIRQFTKDPQFKGKMKDIVKNISKSVQKAGSGEEACKEVVSKLFEDVQNIANEVPEGIIKARETTA